MPVPVLDTRPLFRPLCADLVALLRSLSAAEWERPTLAPAWRVRDVVAHMLDTALRRLSYHRDRMPPAAPSRAIASERDLAALVNELNATWLAAAGRLSPRVLVDLYGVASVQLCDFIEALPSDAPPLFPVSWAGDRGADGLLDIGREFTEIWHHGAQVRDAVGAGPYSEPRWLGAVLGIAIQALPHAYRDVRAAAGASLVVEITGESGGTWALNRTAAGWDVSPGEAPRETARARMSGDVAWRLFFNALPAPSLAAVHISGDVELARPLLAVRSVVV
jgi:uncharacterized protein (TIGR03083 family)